MIIGPEGDKLELSFIGGKHLIASHLFSAHDTSDAEALDDFLAQAIGRNLPGASVDDTRLWPGEQTVGCRPRCISTTISGRWPAHVLACPRSPTCPRPGCRLWELRSRRSERSPAASTSCPRPVGRRAKNGCRPQAWCWRVCSAPRSGLGAGGCGPEPPSAQRPDPPDRNLHPRG